MPTSAASANHSTFLPFIFVSLLVDLNDLHGVSMGEGNNPFLNACSDFQARDPRHFLRAIGSTFA